MQIRFGGTIITDNKADAKTDFNLTVGTGTLIASGDIISGRDVYVVNELRAGDTGTYEALTSDTTIVGKVLASTFADGSASNGQIYYSSNQADISYKDNGGTVYTLNKTAGS